MLGLKLNHVSKRGHRSALSYYLNQCWNITNWTLRNKLQWNFNRNSNIFIQENAFESIVCEMTAILPRPQCVKRIQRQEANLLTHWGRVTHICVGSITIIGSDNGLSPGRRQAIICPNAGISLIGPIRTMFREIFIEIHTFSFKKCIWKCRLENGGHSVPSLMCFNHRWVSANSLRPSDAYKRR